MQRNADCYDQDWESTRRGIWEELEENGGGQRLIQVVEPAIVEA